MQYNTDQYANPVDFEILRKRQGYARKLREQLFHEKTLLAKALLEHPSFIDRPRRPKTYHLEFGFGFEHRKLVEELRLEVCDNGVNTPIICMYPRYYDTYSFETKKLPDGPILHAAVQYLLESLGEQ